MEVDVIKAILVIGAIVLGFAFVQRFNRKRADIRQATDFPFDEKTRSFVKQQIDTGELERIRSIEQTIALLETASNKAINSFSEESAERIDCKSKQLAHVINTRIVNYRKEKEWASCIASHYLSLTTANAIYQNYDACKQLSSRIEGRIKQLSDEIQNLKDIQPSNSEWDPTIAAKCREHKKLCIVCASYKETKNHLYQLLSNQNAITRDYREHIRRHFGKRGRDWYRRMKRRQERRQLLQK